MTMREALVLLSTALVLPMMAVLAIAFVTGRLSGTENAKYTVLREADVDYWAAPEAATAAAAEGSGGAAPEAAADHPRGGVEA
jgi:hypothetical protein